MYFQQRFTQLMIIISCLFAAGVSCTQADDLKKSPNTTQSEQASAMNPMMMGQMGQMPGMMNPHMYLYMMNQMMGQMPGMMNPMMMGQMSQMPGMMNPMMMGHQMGQMPGMMNPMTGMMPGMASGGTSNPMAQMPSGQMMSPKQYEQWFNQMTENMKNMSPQAPATN